MTDLSKGTDNCNGLRGSQLNKSGRPWACNFYDEKDCKLRNHYANMNTSELLSEVKTLSNAVYELGSEEAKEMNRGKLLNILNSTD